MATPRTITTLHNLLGYNAQKFSATEVLLKKKLPGWIQLAFSPALKAVLQKYLLMTEAHIEEMDRFFESEQIPAISITDKIMQAFIEDTTDKLMQCSDTAVTDACLLGCIQAINHFKISMYGTAAAYAHTLEMTRYAIMFHEAEINEKHIDNRLSQLAAYEINLKAKTTAVLPYQ